MAPATLWMISWIEPNGQVQPQNRPRPNTKIVMKMKTQNKKMNGSLRNSVHSQRNSSACSQVSTCVIEGWAIMMKPTQTTKMPQKLYLKMLTGHLFLWLDRRVRRSRTA